METETDMLGFGMAKVTGRTLREMQDRIKLLEWHLDVAEQPHTRGCTKRWETCTCGLRDVMTGPADRGRAMFDREIRPDPEHRRSEP